MNLKTPQPIFLKPAKKTESFLTTGKNARGRGALENPLGRFEPCHNELNPDWLEEEDFAERQVETEVFTDTSKTIISTNDSPDVGMDTTVNPYRGCEHGCIYCYARPTHEYLGMSAGLDFETKIFAKYDAAKLLREKLMSKNWEPRVVSFSGITDCYQPLERKLEITKSCMKVMAEFKNPVAIITKNALVTRDIEIFKELAEVNAIRVMISITSLDPYIARTMEPRASTPGLRLRALEKLTSNGISCGVMVGPVVPALTDHETPAILKSAADAGAVSAGYTMMRLPYGVKDLFQTWAHTNFPERAEHILSRIQDVRGGKLNSAKFGDRMRGNGPIADQIEQMFRVYKAKYGLNKGKRLSADAFQRPPQVGEQIALF